MPKGPNSRSTDNRTNTYNYMTPPTTPAVTALQGMVQQGTDPSIPYAFAKRRENLSNSFKNPLGAYTSPAVRDAADRVLGEKMSMEEAQAVGQSRFNSDQATFDRQALIAQMTRPDLVQSGSSGTSTGTQSQGWGNTVGNLFGAGLSFF